MAAPKNPETATVRVRWRLLNNLAKQGVTLCHLWPPMQMAWDAHLVGLRDELSADEMTVEFARWLLERVVKEAQSKGVKP